MNCSISYQQLRALLAAETWACLQHSWTFRRRTDAFPPQLSDKGDPEKKSMNKIDIN